MEHSPHKLQNLSEKIIILGVIFKYSDYFYSNDSYVSE